MHLVQLALFPSFSGRTKPRAQDHPVPGPVPGSSWLTVGLVGLSLTSHGCQSLTGEWRDKGGS